jgi:hypothetical protein
MGDADKLSYLDNVPARRKKLPRRRLLFVALAVVVAVVPGVLLTRGRGEPKGSPEAIGMCLEVRAENVARDKDGAALARVLVATPDSTEFEVLLPPPVPRPGDFIPLLAEHHRKGPADYRLDAARWKASGPL